MKVKVLLSVDQQVWEAVPAVARWLSLPSDAPTPETASAIFEYFIQEAVLESTIGHSTGNSAEGIEKAVEELLDPSISVPLTIRAATHLGATKGLTLNELFEEYEREAPNDPWVTLVQGKPPEEVVLWRMALATTYQVIPRDERGLPTTWTLIARTYGLSKRGIDNGSISGDNSDSLSGEQPPKT